MSTLLADRLASAKWVRTFETVVEPPAVSPTLIDRLRQELDLGDGTPEWLAFVARSCKRNHVT